MDAHSGYPGTVPPPQVWTALVGLGTAFAGQNVGIKEISDKIWFVSFMGYDLRFFDHEIYVSRINLYPCPRNGP